MKAGRILFAGSAMGAALMGAGAAAAQSDDTSGADIVVTAQRRSERLQDVPVSVQVVTGKDVTERNFNGLEALAKITPSLTVTKGGATNFLQIRGVGSGGSQGFDQSVATFVDDIYHGRSRATGTTFLDLERIEVLKGPQSTFFGNNAIAGALNIVTARPGRDWGGYARALYGEHGQFVAEAAAGGPITDTLGIRVAGTFNGTNGWLQNSYLDAKYPRDRNLAGRITLAWNPTSDFDATFKVEAGRNRRDGDLNLQIVDCPPPAPFTAGAFCNSAIGQNVPLGFGDTNSEGPQRVRIGSLDSALSLNYHLGNGATLSSVTGFYGYRYGQHLDLDATPAFLITTDAPETYRQWSQELRLASPTGQPIEYLVGLYYQNDRLTYAQDGIQAFRNGGVQANPALAALIPYLPLGQAIHYRQNEQVYSAFGSLTWNATSRIKLSAGLRASWVDKDYDRQLYYGIGTRMYGGIAAMPAALQPLAATVFGVPASVDGGSRKDRALMPSARIQYQPNRDVMIYMSYSRGFKAGGFNGSDASGVATNIPFDPEHVNAYEIGLKSEWFDRHLIFNLAAFRSDYSNLQVTVREGYQNGPGYAVVRNAASSRSQGVEAELRYVPNSRVNLGVNLTYLDSAYTSFPNASPNSLQQAQGIKVQDLSGAMTPYSPRWSGSLNASYTQPIGGMKLTGEISPFYSSHYIVLPGEAPTTQKDYVRLDARIALATMDGKWSIDLIGKNLTNTTILTFASLYPTSLGSYLFAKDETRNVAVQLRYNF